jgi:DNA-directed RNA polymerase specialized sigma24 family protein
VSPVSAKEKLYRKFRGGDGGALVELLEGEREALYDYLLRLTGQMSRSYETIDEVFVALSDETVGTLDTYAELRTCLFVTARRFNADIWNADTARLREAELGESVGDEDELRRALQIVDRALRTLPGVEREAALLVGRLGFSRPEAAEIMSLSDTEVELREATGYQHIDAALLADTSPGDTPPDGFTAAQLIARLPRHTLPPRSSQRTIDLSMVMQGIKTRPDGLGSPLRIALILFVGVAAGLLLFFRPMLGEMLAQLRGVFGDGG